MSISLNLNKIKAEIPENVLLVAVSKTKPIEDLKIAYESGQLHFGENKIQELIYKEIALPFGIQSTQVHLNFWKEDDFLKFEKFIIKNNKKIISFEDALKKVNKNIIYLFINWITGKSLKTIRSF